MSLDLCLKQLHVVHIKVFLSYAVYTFALVLLRHFPVRHFPVLHFPVLQIPPLRLRPSFSSPANSTPPRFLMVRHFPVLQIPVTQFHRLKTFSGKVVERSTTHRTVSIFWQGMTPVPGKFGPKCTDRQ